MSTQSKCNTCIFKVNAPSIYLQGAFALKIFLKYLNKSLFIVIDNEIKMVVYLKVEENNVIWSKFVINEKEKWYYGNERGV